MHYFNNLCKITSSDSANIYLLTFLHLTNLHNSITLNVTVQPYDISRQIYACIRICRLIIRCAERLSMSKTAAAAAISTKCGFTNGAC